MKLSFGQNCFETMRHIIYSFVFVLSLTACYAQQTANRTAHCENPDFDRKVERLISFSVPTISVEELVKMEDVFIADTREQEEYAVSHIPNAQFVGYKKFDVANLGDIPKDTPIVLYCSVGYRSEKIGEKLQKKGYTNVYNLYGSIFEWVNQGQPVVTPQGEETNNVHTYNEKWSQWLEDGKAKKIW